MYQFAIMSLLNNCKISNCANPLVFVFIASIILPFTPSLVMAQYSASLDANKSTSGSGGKYGNYITTGGSYSLTVNPGVFGEITSITAELQYKSGGVWYSWSPPEIQDAAFASGVWGGKMWPNLTGGYTYRIKAIMYFQYKLNENDEWTKKTQENTGYEKVFP